MYLFYPSCNYAIASKENAMKLRKFMSERMDVAGCCLKDNRKVNSDDTGIYMCQNCRSTIENKMQTLSLWEYLLKTEYPLPDYRGEKMFLQDCWRDRTHPEVHHAVRELMKRMGIEIVEMNMNREKSDYCGTLHCETDNEELRQKMLACSEQKISRLPLDLQTELMKDHFRDVEEGMRVVVDCNRCKKGAEMAGVNAVHLMDLILKE